MKVVYNSLSVRFGLALRLRRLQMGISQEKLADNIGMSRSYYWKIEHGKKNPQMDTIEKVCKGLDAEIWRIFKEAHDIKDPEKLAKELKER